MSKRPQDTSAEEPDGGNPHIRFRGGPRQGDRPGLLNINMDKKLLQNAPNYDMNSKFEWTPEYGRKVDSYYKTPRSLSGLVD